MSQLTGRVSRTILINNWFCVKLTSNRAASLEKLVAELDCVVTTEEKAVPEFRICALPSELLVPGYPGVLLPIKTAPLVFASKETDVWIALTPFPDSAHFMRAAFADFVSFHIYPKGILHASLVSVRDTGILIVGQKHSGKSTLSAALTELNGTFVGDEMIVCYADSDRLIGQRLYKGINLTRNTRSLLVGKLSESHKYNTGFKERYSFPSNITTSSIQIDAILFPRILPEIIKPIVEPLDEVIARTILQENTFGIYPLTLLPIPRTYRCTLGEDIGENVRYIVDTVCGQ